MVPDSTVKVRETEQLNTSQVRGGADSDMPGGSSSSSIISLHGILPSCTLHGIAALGVGGFRGIYWN